MHCKRPTVSLTRELESSTSGINPSWSTPASSSAPRLKEGRSNGPVAFLSLGSQISRVKPALFEPAAAESTFARPLPPEAVMPFSSRPNEHTSSASSQTCS